jgi:hypothetical protein
MATVFKPGGVRDVPHGEFIAAYAKHLKGNDRVRPSIYFLRRGSAATGGAVESRGETGARQAARLRHIANRLPDTPR